MAGAENPLLVFISSVMDTRVEDLAAERDAAVAAIDSLPITRSWAFEYSPASADRPDETYLKKVDECDIFLLILGGKITDPVHREYDRARQLGKRCLLFVKRSKRRTARAAAWLAERRLEVKYEHFEGEEDLGERVTAAVVDEVIRSHRKLNLQERDYASLVRKIRSEPVSFMVRTIEAHELREVTATFPELTELYPDFESWVDDKAISIKDGAASAYVATYGSENAGFALVTDKAAGVRKLSTLYIKPPYQGRGVGPRLLYGVIVQAARDQIEKLYVTVSEERREQLEGLLTQFGFFVEGVSGRRYRAGSWEWVWTKRLVHGYLQKRHLDKFAVKYFLEERGLVADRMRPGLYKAVPRYDLLGLVREEAQGGLIMAVAIEEADLEYRRGSQIAGEMGLPFLFVSSEPLGVIPAASDTCVDTFDLEAMFFPIYVEQADFGLIVPIKETFAQRLIPTSLQSQFLEPTRVQLRTDNVYYRFPNSYDGLKRASPLFFYETDRSVGSSRLIGEAKLLEYAVDLPQDLLARFGRLGVYALDDLKKAAIRRGPNRGKALALKFDWYREVDRPLRHEQIRRILPTFNPMTARRVDPTDVLRLRRLAGWNVTPLSFR